MKYRPARLTAIALITVCLAGPAVAQNGKTDLTGKWLFTVETTAGSGTPTITLKQDADKLTGHYSGQLGESDLTGSIKGQDLAFTFNVDAQGYALKVTYTGTIESNDSLKGKVDLGGLAGGTFTAKRQ
jgi:hypothetical protein